jgi:hypothetical protein
MKWLLDLYPPAWQRRYRDEMEAQLNADLPKLRTATDLVAGAIDAWMNPGLTSSLATAEESRNMITASRIDEVLDIVPSDALRGVSWAVVFTLVLVGVGVGLDKTVAPREENVFIAALLSSSWLVAFATSTRYTYLKPYSMAVKNVITITASICLYALALGWSALP